jgi:ribosomal protein S18 acetylase RimI-like enzyme
MFYFLNDSKMTIRPLSSTEKLPFDLLLLADPSVKMMGKYIFISAVYVAIIEAQIVGVLALLPIDETLIEIKNIAVLETHQGKGIGKKLLEFALSEAREKGFQDIQIGTANSSIGQLTLYQKMGFEMDCIIKSFFTDNYPEPMYENGILVRDMIVLKKALGLR